MYTHFHWTTLNQPSSPSPSRSSLTKESVAGLLGYDPAGETVARICETLASGKGVEVYTKQVPMDKDTEAVGFRFLPYVEIEDGKLPSVDVIVRF